MHDLKLTQHPSSRASLVQKAAVSGAVISCSHLEELLGTWHTEHQRLAAPHWPRALAGDPSTKGGIEIEIEIVTR